MIELPQALLDTFNDWLGPEAVDTTVMVTALYFVRRHAISIEPAVQGKKLKMTA